MEIKQIRDIPFDQNSYIVNYLDNIFVVDPGFQSHLIIDYLTKENLKPTAILLTHYHFDHVAGVDNLCQKYEIKAYIHEADHDFLLRDTLSKQMNFGVVTVNKNYIISFDDKGLEINKIKINFLNKPGHSKGSCIFIFDDYHFLVGDFIFQNSVGRIDFVGGSEEEMKKSLAEFEEYRNKRDEIKIYPGHGPVFIW